MGHYVHIIQFHHNNVPLACITDYIKSDGILRDGIKELLKIKAAAKCKRAKLCNLYTQFRTKILHKRAAKQLTLPLIP